MTLARFPPGDPVLVGRPFEEAAFAEIDQLLREGYCPEGWVDFEVEDTRVSCLVHQSKPFLAGLTEPERFSWVPLYDLITRVRRLQDAICSVYKADLARVLLMAVHFRNQPSLQGSTRLVDLTHVLDVLAQDGHDAAVALERGGKRTVLFLQQGLPSRIYFVESADDPGGEDVTNRFLLHGYAKNLPDARLEVFTKLNIQPDPDAGRTLRELAEEAKPPPPMNVICRLNEQIQMQRPFMPPYMIIGRDRSCELILSNVSVSREHAKLSWARGRFMIEDLGSANGIRVNGTRLNRTKIIPGDRIGVGIYEVELIPPQVMADPKATMMMVPGEDNLVLHLVGESQDLALDGTIAIGKGAEAHLKARGAWVRNIHARIAIEGSGVYHLTCQGRARVRLNGKVIRDAYVQAGDELHVGKSRFQVVAMPKM